MAKIKPFRAAKYCLTNYKCGKCNTGVVQIFQEVKRGGNIITQVSGCKDCGHEYGILQSSKLELCPVDYDIRWC